MSESNKRVVTPIFLQMHATECGAACLGMVLGYFGRWVPLSVLRDDCNVSRDGCTAASILRAAKKYKLECKGLSVNAEILPKLKYPLILFWQYSHFVVLEGIENDGYILNDPAIGRRTVSREDFLNGYSYIALQFERGKDFKPGGRQVSLYKKIQPLLAGTYTDLVLLMACAILLAVLFLLIPSSIKFFIDSVVVGQNSWLPVVVALIAGGLFTYFISVLKHRTLQRMSIRISIMGFDRGVRHLLRLPVEFFTRRLAGDIMDRVSSNDRIGKSLVDHYISLLIEITLALIMLAALFVIDTGLALIIVLLILIHGGLIKYFNSLKGSRGEILSREQGMLLGLGMQLLSHLDNLRMTGSDDRFFSRWAGQQALELKARQLYTEFIHYNEALPILMGAIRNAAILFLGGSMVISDEMSVGTFVGFFVLTELAMTPISRILEFTEKRLDIVTDFERIEDITSSSEDLSFHHQESDSDSIITFKGNLQLAGQLELKNISFGFSKGKPPLVGNFNLLIKPGQRVALVGPSGSGKSTLARIVAGILQPWEGQVLFDNHLREDIPTEVMRRSIAMVDQEVVLFPATVRENITLWNSELSDDVIFAAARDACIHHDILIRPQGYSTFVQEDGKNFSGGQRQRIEIARALVGNPSLLILDEATSSLDPLVELEIDNALRRRGVTCLIIAHRLSTIRDCDMIVVLEKGKEVQRGTHEDLIADENGTYFRLVKSE